MIGGADKIVADSVHVSCEILMVSLVIQIEKTDVTFSLLTLLFCCVILIQIVNHQWHGNRAVSNQHNNHLVW